jgi:ribosomal protein L4
MAEASETEEVVETTPQADWIVPNQDLIEKVVDARIEKLKAEEKPSRSRSRSSHSDSKSS